jgi:DNA-binding MarR family transcriptional regulator
MNQPIFDTNQETAYLLGEVCRAFHGRIETMLGEVGLPRGQARLLGVLCHNDGASQTELADLLMVRPATMTNLLQRMERDGLIERRPDANDQRLTRVFVKASGREKELGVLEVFEQLTPALLLGFSPEDREQLQAFLRQLLANLNTKISALERVDAAN